MNSISSSIGSSTSSGLRRQTRVFKGLDEFGGNNGHIPSTTVYAIKSRFGHLKLAAGDVYMPEPTPLMPDVMSAVIDIRSLAPPPRAIANIEDVLRPRRNIAVNPRRTSTLALRGIHLWPEDPIFSVGPPRSVEEAIARVRQQKARRG